MPITYRKCWIVLEVSKKLKNRAYYRRHYYNRVMAESSLKVGEILVWSETPSKYFDGLTPGYALLSQITR